MDKYLAKTLFGLEDILKTELESMGARDVKAGRRSVSFKGDKKLLYKVNYNSRTALSVLKPLHSFRINNAKDLYSNSINYPWEDFLSVGQTFSIVPVVHSGIFSHTAYPALLLKDAIADHFRKKFGKRPSVNRDNPDIVFNCHISEKQVTISQDSTVQPLFKRGYRKVQSEAPLNETLAAGIILRSGWDMKSPFLDPMCGSGTIAIEAALMAKNIAPGRLRPWFGFMNWTDFDVKLFRKVKDEASENVRDIPEIISCSDISSKSVRIAGNNIRNAGLERDIAVSTADFLSTGESFPGYTVIINPPYGERLEADDINNMYKGIGDRLKKDFPGSRAWIVSSNYEALKNVGLRPSSKTRMYNGKLEVKLQEYILYEGSRKIF